MKGGAATHACPSFGMTTTQDITDLFARHNVETSPLYGDAVLNA